MSTENKPVYYDGSGTLTLPERKDDKVTAIKPETTETFIGIPYFPWEK
jgi:hypothetical protein